MSQLSLYDVFLSHSLKDQGLAKLVTSTFVKAGLTVFEYSSIQAGQSFTASIRQALAESWALVVLVTRDSLESKSLMVEIGMGLAWSKPTLILHDGVDVGQLPSILSGYQVVPLSHIEQVIEQVRNLREKYDDAQIAALVQVYSDFQTPVDRLVMQPAVLGEIVDSFQQRTGVMASSERLVAELLRLRKQGMLPRIKAVVSQT